MQVQELAMRVAMAPYVVRYYARLGLLRPTRAPRNRYQHFSQADLQRLPFIDHTKRLGFTLGEVRLVLEIRRKGKTPCPRETAGRSGRTDRPGDIVMLSAGNLVPGDCLLDESKDLFVDEATLTGETSFPRYNKWKRSNLQ